jgi:hypothetical protein
VDNEQAVNAVFAWTGPLPADEDVGADSATRYSGDFGEQWAYEACTVVGTAVLESIRELRRATNVGAPYFGDQSMHFSVELDGQEYSLIVMWIPHGNRDNFFAVQPWIRRGCLASLFLARPRDSELIPVRELLRAALDSHPCVGELEWVGDVHACET